MVLFLLLLSNAVFAGSIKNFTSAAVYPNSKVDQIVTLPDGKKYILGPFTALGVSTGSTARLNTDGTFDSSFDAKAGIGGQVYRMAQQSDGKIIAVGGFSISHGSSVPGIVRLNSDGSFDSTFTPGTGINNKSGTALAVQSDGKILVGGDFTSYNGTGRNRIVRLNTDGTVDTGFSIGTGFNGAVYDIKLQSDGKILAAGSFTTYAGTSRPRIARINTDGSIDTGFTPGTGFDATVYGIALDSAGDIYATGDFANFAGTGRAKIARLNSDGTLDTGFDPGTGLNYFPYRVAVQTDDKVIAVGYFTTYRGVSRNSIVRINTDGTLDTGFTPGSGAQPALNVINFNTYEVKVLSSGKIFLVANANTYNGVTRNLLMRINSDGTLDTSFDSGDRILVPSSSALIQSDDKVVIVGGIKRDSGVSRTGIARLNRDNTLDTSFSAGTGPNGSVQHMVAQSDGKLILCGSFTSFNGTGRNRIVRLNLDGTVDTSFNPGTGFNDLLFRCPLQSDGKVVALGRFTSFNGTGRAQLARLNTDGTLDTTFDPGTGLTGSYNYSLAVDSNDKYVIAGAFTSYNGTTKNRIARVNNDGSVDTTFDGGTGFNSGNVYRIVFQSDGKIIAGGDFSSYNGTARNDFVRISTDGSLDTTFTSGVNFSGTADLQLQSDGKVIVVGMSSGAGLCRLNTNGSVDVCVPTSVWNVSAAGIEANGHILVGHWDPFFSDSLRPFFLRLKRDFRLDY